MPIIYNTQQPTIDTNAFAAGDALGGLLTFPMPFRQGLIKTVQIIDDHLQNAKIDLLLFGGEAPTAGTNNAAYSLATADLNKLLCVVTFEAADYKGFTTYSVAHKELGGVPYANQTKVTPGDANLYGQLVIREIKTYNAATDIRVRVGMLPYA